MNQALHGKALSVSLSFQPFLTMQQRRNLTESSPNPKYQNSLNLTFVPKRLGMQQSQGSVFLVSHPTWPLATLPLGLPMHCLPGDYSIATGNKIYTPLLSMQSEHLPILL